MIGADATVGARIGAGLDAIAHEEGVRLVVAVESGSRAWGFASPDSDWDVRFVYARPAAWFVSLDTPRDVIERPALGGDPLLDVSGWDMRKALNLALRGNAVLGEWLASPIGYREAPEMRAALQEFLAATADLSAAARHYASLARRIRETYLTGERVNLKKYLYALRPALCLRWLRAHGAMPPMELPALLPIATAPGEAEMFAELLARKAEASELGEGPRLPVADALIAGMLAWAEASPLPARSAAQQALGREAALALLRRSADWASGG